MLLKSVWTELDWPGLVVFHQLILAQPSRRQPAALRGCETGVGNVASSPAWALVGCSSAGAWWGPSCPSSDGAKGEMFPQAQGWRACLQSLPSIQCEVAVNTGTEMESFTTIKTKHNSLLETISHAIFSLWRLSGFANFSWFWVWVLFIFKCQNISVASKTMSSLAAATT